MAEEKRKISELPSNDSPSTSTVLVGVDGSDTVKIPITEFVLSESSDDITISSGRDINISANDAVEISANRTLGITAVENIGIESSNTMTLNSSGANINFLPDGDMEVYADGNIDLYSDNYVSLSSNGDTSITSEGAISVITPGFLGMWGDQAGLYGINGIEFLAGENDESYLYASGDMMQIMSPQTSISNVHGLSTKANGKGQPGQVLTTDGSTVYWGNPSGGGSGGSTPMTYITHSELKALRDNGQLIPGMFYRITDYQCTTSQEGTRAMNNRFDIIVQALSEDRLSEIAKADFNDEDSYFADNGANLAAWEIKYCLDDDATRFAWASAGLQITENIQSFYTGDILVRAPEMDWTFEYGDYPYAWTTEEIRNNGRTDNRDYVYTTTLVPTVNTSCAICKDDGWDYDGITVLFNISGGKGVIYYMKDEHGNECPYDFKNIQFMRYISLENGYPEFDEENGEETWVYTFCGNSYHIDNDEWSELKDGSLESPYGHIDDNTFGGSCSYNIIKPFIDTIDYFGYKWDEGMGLQYLNNNVFLGSWSEVGSSEEEYYWYYNYCPHNNYIGNNSSENTFGRGCCNNTIGVRCNGNTIGEEFFENVVGNGFGWNTIGDYFSRNIIGDAMSSNKIEFAYNNKFDRDCFGNVIGVMQDCDVGFNFYSNSLPEAYKSTFGYDCNSNIFEDVVSQCWVDPFISNYVITGCNGIDGPCRVERMLPSAILTEREW